MRLWFLSRICLDALFNWKGPDRIIFFVNMEAVRPKSVQTTLFTPTLDKPWHAPPQQKKKEKKNNCAVVLFFSNYAFFLQRTQEWRWCAKHVSRAQKWRWMLGKAKSVHREHVNKKTARFRTGPDPGVLSKHADTFFFSSSLGKTPLHITRPDSISRKDI